MRYDVRLNNASLNDISERIGITDVSEDKPNENVQTVQNGYSFGSRLLRKTRKSLSISVSFVATVEDTQQRADIYARIQRWANGGGYLTISNYAGKRLYIDNAELPSLGSVKNWTDEITITLTAYAMPYWESAYPLSAAISTAARTGSTTLIPPGNADECLVDVEIRASGGVNALTITAGDTSMTFAALGLTSGQTLKIGHNDDGLLTMKIGDVSVMSKRTAASSDDLKLVPGKIGTVSFNAGSPCTAVFRTRGRWL